MTDGKPMLARRFNSAGLHEFRSYIELERTEVEPPRHLLSDNGLTEPLPFQLEVSPLETDSKYDLGVKVLTGMDDTDVPQLLNDTLVWPWLSLYFSPRTFPLRDGKYFIGHQQRHIITNAAGWAKYDHGHRHLVRAAAQSVLYFNEFARVLGGKVSEHTKLEEQILSRKSLYPLAYMKNAVEALYRMFWDPKHNRARRGAAGTGAGGIIDFVRTISQLDVNYDVVSLEATKLIELLPDSFSNKKPAST